VIFNCRWRPILIVADQTVILVVLKKIKKFLYISAIILGIFAVLIPCLFLNKKKIKDENNSYKQSEIISYNAEIDSNLEKYFSSLHPFYKDGKTLEKAFGPDGTIIDKADLDIGEIENIDGSEFDSELNDLVNPASFIPAGYKGVITPENPKEIFHDKKNSNSDNPQIRFISLANIGDSVSDYSKSADSIQYNAVHHENLIPVIDEDKMPELIELKNLDNGNFITAENHSSGSELNGVGGPDDSDNFKLVKYKISKSLYKPKKIDSSKVYIVKTGDSLWKIANKFGIKFSNLLKLNLKYKNRILHPGNKIILPGNKIIKNKKSKTKRNNSKKKISKRKRTKKNSRYKWVKRTKYYRVKKGDTLSKIAKKYGASVSSLKKLNNIKKHYISNYGFGELVSVDFS